MLCKCKHDRANDRGAQVDKLYFCKIVRTPPQFDESLVLWTTYTVEYGVLIHCLLGFWAYTSPRMFPITAAQAQEAIVSIVPLTINSSDPVSDNQIDFWAELSFRFARGDGSIIILLPALCIVAWKMTVYVLRGATFVRRPLHFFLNGARTLVGRDQVVHKSMRGEVAQDTFTDALKDGRAVGTISYNILANPAYQRMFFMQGGNDNAGGEGDDKSTVGGASRAPHNDDDVESVASGSDEAARGMASHGSFQSLHDALNLKRGQNAVDNITKRQFWGDDDGKSFVSSSSNASKTSKLYEKPVKPAGEAASVASSSRSGKHKPPAAGGDAQVDDNASVTSSRSAQHKPPASPERQDDDVSVTSSRSKSRAAKADADPEASSNQVQPFPE